MKVISTIGVVVGAIILAACQQRLRSDSSGKFREQQAWSYVSRTGEEESFLVIRNIEPVPPYGEIAFISVHGLSLTDPNGGHVGTAYMAISTSTLSTLVKNRVDHDWPAPSWETYYAAWHRSLLNHSSKPSALPRSIIEVLDEADRGRNSPTSPSS